MTDAAKKRVFLVEDEPLIMVMLEGMLRDLGYVVAGKALTLKAALAELDVVGGAIDLAVLDVNLNGVESYPLAEKLCEIGVPVLFSTGYGAHGLKNGYKRWPTLQKPYSEIELAAALRELKASDNLH